MINGKRIVVVLPAFNAEKTLEATVRELPDLVDQCILVDDKSRDQTVAVARRLGLQVVVHEQNRGYGGNQKTCYSTALERGADVVVMIHPDYQYSPLLVTAMASMVAYGVYDVALGSRILGNGALRGGMPIYKYLSNRALTTFQNFLLGARMSEYHTGFRAYDRQLLTSLPLSRNSDDFVFDNQILAQAVLFGASVEGIRSPGAVRKPAMTAGTAELRGRSLWDVLLPLLLLLALGRLWLMPMGSSFWVDEMGTVFVVQHGPRDPSLSVAPNK